MDFTLWDSLFHSMAPIVPKFHLALPLILFVIKVFVIWSCRITLCSDWKILSWVLGSCTTENIERYCLGQTFLFSVSQTHRHHSLDLKVNLILEVKSSITQEQFEVHIQATFLKLKTTEMQKSGEVLQRWSPPLVVELPYKLSANL